MDAVKGSDHQKPRSDLRGQAQRQPFQGAFPTRGRQAKASSLQVLAGQIKRVLNNGNGGFELNDRAKWIQRMFELALSMGQDLIADKLYEEGFHSEEGKYLNGKAIGSYLSDRAVLGEWFPTTIEKDPVTGARKKKQVGPVKPDLFPPAVSEELFNRVQEARFKRRTNETYNNGGGSLKHLFGGACYCDHCGGLVDRFTQKGGYKPMLRCRNRQCSAKKGIHYNEAELLGQLQGFRWNQFFRDDRKGELLSQINQQMLAEQDELNKEKAKLMNLQASQTPDRSSKAGNGLSIWTRSSRSKRRP